MALRFRILSLVAALIFAAAATSCTSSPKNADTTDSGSDAKSGADEVGSIPEDMLANEKGGDNGDAADAKADGKEAPQAAEGNDPFADLKSGDKAEGGTKGESTTVDEAMAEPKDNGAAEAEAPAAGSATTGETSAYSVKSGDTLMKVAFNLYGDTDRWKDLQEWNRGALKNGTALRRGMKLQYEVPAEPFQADQHDHSYEIKKGDTLAGIADDLYGRRAKYKKLQNYNAKLIRNPNRIFAGFTIYYDITAKEMAEAEARHKERDAMGGTAPAPTDSGQAPPTATASDNPPSALAPPEAAPAKNIAVAPTPTATATPAGAEEMMGPPAPPGK